MKHLDMDYAFDGTEEVTFLYDALVEEDRARAEFDAVYDAMWAAREAGDWDLYSDLHKDLYGVR